MEEKQGVIGESGGANQAENGTHVTSVTLGPARETQGAAAGCRGTTRDGRVCHTVCLPGQEYCRTHAPSLGVVIDAADIETPEGCGQVELRVLIHFLATPGIPPMWAREVTTLLRDLAEKLREIRRRADAGRQASGGRRREAGAGRLEPEAGRLEAGRLEAGRLEAGNLEAGSRKPGAREAQAAAAIAEARRALEGG